MCFRLTPSSMILDDLDLLYIIRISRNFADLGANSGKTNDDRPVLLATELYPIKHSTFQRCIDYVDITGRSSARRHQTRVGGKNKLFSS